MGPRMAWRSGVVGLVVVTGFTRVVGVPVRGGRLDVIVGPPEEEEEEVVVIAVLLLWAPWVGVDEDDGAVVATSCKSYPAQKAWPPAPVRMQTFWLSSCSNRRKASASNFAVGAFTALRTWGLLMVMSVMPSIDGS